MTPLVQSIIQDLKDLLAQPAWQGGAKLPPETQLAEQLNVSRPVLRQALKALAEEGLIVSRRGSGHFSVRRASQLETAFDRPRSMSDLRDCFRFREAIESKAAAEAARNATPDSLVVLERALAQTETSSVGHSVLDADIAFHAAIAHASKNKYFVQAFAIVAPHISKALEVGRELNGISPTITSRRVGREHRAIFEAIRSGDENAAFDAMHAHVHSGLLRLFGEKGW